MTEDGSSSLFVDAIQEHFHSKFGAIQEAIHIFIQNGLLYSLTSSDATLSILEIGFGTGLNCFLTLMQPEIQNKNVYYEGIELYPLDINEYKSLNYPNLIATDQPFLFAQLHETPWENENKITSHFTLKKRKVSFDQAVFNSAQFDLVYFDPFSPDKQPEMWTKECFDMLYFALKPGAYLLTYCTKGIVKRALKEAGFQIEKLPGPIGKREILRANKPAKQL